MGPGLAPRSCPAAITRGPTGTSVARVPVNRSNIEVERVLPRMRAEPYGVHLVLALVLDPRLDHVRREDIALQQPIVGLLEVVEHDAEVAGELLDLLRLGGRELVEVLFGRLCRVGAVGGPVQPRPQGRREGQIRGARVFGRPGIPWPSPLPP